MNKSVVLISLMVMTLTLSVAGMGTMAWFTDETAVEGNSFVTGEVSIAHNESSELPLNLFDGTTTMSPGDTDSTIISIENDGDSSIYLKASIEETTYSGISYLPDQLIVSVGITDGSYENTYDDSLTNIIDSDLVWNSSLGPPKEVAPGESVDYEIEVVFSETADSSYANSTWNGDIVFTAVQSDNQDEFNVVWENPVE